MSTPNRSHHSVMTWFFVLFVVGSILYSAHQGTLRAATDQSLAAAKDSVTLAIGLVGVMALWLGFMRVLEVGGFLHVLARLLRPIMTRLFPEVPPEHPAMGAMILNMSANMLGLGNAATPFGLRAMAHLNRLNPLPGVATNAMCLFLAINTSSITILPLGVIAVRAAAGSKAPAAIFLPTLLATTLSTLTGILVALYFARRDREYRAQLEAAVPLHRADEATETAAETSEDFSRFQVTASVWERVLGYAAIVLFFGFAARSAMAASDMVSFIMNDFFSFWLLPGLMLLIASYGLIRGVKIYEAVVDGAKQGFETAVRIIPFLVAILVAVSLVRSSGMMDLFARSIEPLTSLVAMPAEAVPMALIRPLSGTGAFGIMSSVVNAAPDSYQAFVVSVMNGSCDTTFYILAVYFGSVGIVRYRHAVIAGLTADVVGLFSAALLSRAFWTPV